MDITTHTHTQLGGGIDQTARTNESERALGVVFFFRPVWLAWVVSTSGATVFAEEGTFFVWPGRAFPPRCLDASMPVPFSPSNYNFLDQVARGPTPFLSCLVSAFGASLGTSESRTHTHTNINGDRNSFSDGAEFLEFSVWGFGDDFGDFFSLSTSVSAKNGRGGSGRRWLFRPWWAVGVWSGWAFRSWL